MFRALANKRRGLQDSMVEEWDRKVVRAFNELTRAELIETAMTLGANRWQILSTIVLPAVAPKILVSMRQMLAVSWTYLVIAEIVAATTGIGAVMMRGQRFLKVDEIMAGILVIGMVGLFFDFLFRLAYRVLFPYVANGQR